MILVKYCETKYDGHDCWGKIERNSYTRYAEFSSVDEWLSFKTKSQHNIEFLKMYVVKEVVE